MRQAHNARRSRGRSNRKHNVPLKHQNFESNGPDVRIRGNAHQVYEKYLAMARDANSAGDRISAEGYYQHAEHYFRIMNESTDPQSGNRQQQRGRENGHDRQPRDGEVPIVTEDTPQPDTEAAPVAALAEEPVERPAPARPAAAPELPLEAEQAQMNGTATDSAPAPAPKRRPRRVAKPKAEKPEPVAADPASEDKENSPAGA